MNTKLCFGWLLPALFFVGLHPVSAQTLEETLRRADNQFDNGFYFTALNSYNDALKSDANNIHALARKGDCYFQLNQPAEALPWYDRAVTLGRAEPEVMFRYGKALMFTGDYIGAKKWFSYYSQYNAATGKHFEAMCDYATQSAGKLPAYQVKNELINSAAADYAPAFLGNRVVFNSSRKDIARRQPKGESSTAGNEIFITQRNPEDGMLQRPTHLLSDLQKSPFFNEGPAAYSSNGGKVAFCHNKYVEGSRQIAEKGVEMSLYIADVNADGRWNGAKPFQYNAGEYAVGYPWLSDDGNTLYFASNMPGGLGGWDLYVSTWQAMTNQWSAPRNLGPTVNTEGNEVSPFMSGKNLYFASDWHNGFGGLDVFMADMNGQYASSVVNMGPGINSARDDYGFVYDERLQVGYFVSNRAEGRGNEDIWQATKNTAAAALNTLDEFTISVVDANRAPVPFADIDFSSCGAGLKQTDASGQYAFAVPVGQANCVANVKKAGYTDASLVVTSAGEKKLTVVMQLVGAYSPLTYNVQPTAPAGTANTEMLGTVYDKTTREPIWSARVSAQAFNGGAPIEAFTNYSGQYTLSLTPRTQYVITAHKDGYTDAYTSVISGEPTAQNTVAQILLDSYTGAGSAAAPANTAYPMPFVSPATYSTEQQGKMKDVKPTIKGYSVQLAAEKGILTDEEINRYDWATDHGNLYTKQEGAYTKLLLGVFGSKTDADEVLKSVKTKRKDAFVVKEEAADPALAVSDVTTLADVSMVGQQKGVTTPPASVKPLAPAVRFAVQVATADANAPIVVNNYANLTGFGNLYTRPENGATRIRVGIWESQTEAEKAQTAIMALGYRDAVVVVEKNDAEVPVAQPVQTYVAPAPVSPSPAPAYTAPAMSPQLSTPAGGGLPDLLGGAPQTYSTPTGDKKTKMAPLSVGAANNLKVDYFVRICSLTGEVSDFNVAKAEKAGGTVDARISQSGATIMLLKGFANETEALNAQQKLIALGFKDAYAVKELDGDGILRRISE